MSALCTCAAQQDPKRVALLEIGDLGRVISLRCPNCELPALTDGQLDGLHCEELLVTVTTIREHAESDEPELVWYALSEPPAELLERAE